MGKVTIAVHPLQPRGLRFEAAGGTRQELYDRGLWEQEDSRTFDSLVQELVIYAFRGRPACLIELDPGERYYETLRPDYADLVTVEFKLKRRRSLLELIEGRSRVGGYLTFVPSCSEQLLRDVVVSYGFEAGESMLTAITYDQQERAGAVAEHVYRTGYISTAPKAEEVLAEVDDGTAVIWLNPPVSIEEIVSEIERIAASVGWSVDASALKGT